MVGDFDGEGRLPAIPVERQSLREEAKIATCDAGGKKRQRRHRGERTGAPPARASPSGKPAQAGRPRTVSSAANKPSRSRRKPEQIDRACRSGEFEATLEEGLAQPLAASDIAEAGKRLKTLNDEIAQLEERWLALSDKLESLAV